MPPHDADLMNAGICENACEIGREAPRITSAGELTCTVEPHAMLGCLPCILRLLNSLSLMPVHNGGQPLVDARIAVVLHIGDSQERQCICATRPVFNAVQCPSLCKPSKRDATCHVDFVISQYAIFSYERPEWVKREL